MSKLTSRQMLKAHNTRLKRELYDLKESERYNRLIITTKPSNIMGRVILVNKLLAKKL